jgi:hypothetical protein
MGVAEYAVAAIIAAIASSALLWQRHGRLPFRGVKATLWWTGIVGLDAGVAILCLVGAFGSTGASLEGTGGILRAAGVGLLGPLGLRSQVGKRRIRGRIERVGPTYVYDLIRVPMEQELFERMTRLRRRDRLTWTKDLEAQGWDWQSLVNRIDEHLTEMAEERARDPKDLKRLSEKVDAALTVPSDAGKMKALVDLALKEHFWTVLEEAADGPPDDSLKVESQRAG